MAKRKPLYYRARDSFLYDGLRMLRIRGQSEPVARGFALGMIVNFFPTFGFGVLLSGVVARSLGGNVVAGLVGGATLNFLWPLLFYLNIWTGSHLLRKPTPVAEPAAVTEKAVQSLVWGQAFTYGAMINAAVCGLVTYLIIWTLYRRMRPRLLDWFGRRIKARHRSHLPRLGKLVAE